MRLLVRLLLALLLAGFAARAAIYLVYAAYALATPVEIAPLEGRMVLLAYRVQRGLRLYPEWWDYPHVTNFFGPVDFVAIGLLGRALRADIPGLIAIGRAMSFVPGLATSLILGIWIGRRHGRGAGLAGGLASLGAAPMNGLSVMARPDMLAEFLGVAGFLLAVGEARPARWAGTALLVLAALTKQPAGVFLLAAALAWAAEGRRRRALGVLGGGLAALLVVVAAVQLLAEPNFVRSLLGEAATPWDPRIWLVLVFTVARHAPELAVLPALAMVVWLGRRPRDVRPAVLTAAVVAGAVGLSGKTGAALNYYVSLRVVEAMAVGTLWHAALEARGWSRAWSAAAIVAAAATLVPALPLATTHLGFVRAADASFRRPSGQALLARNRDIYALARDPRVRLLTDSSMVELYQGERAAFGDPWLFKVMVETGRIRPTLIEKRIDERYYDLVVTEGDLFSPGYATRDFRLPMSLVERLRARYAPLDSGYRSYLYVPRDRPARVERSP